MTPYEWSGSPRNAAYGTRLDSGGFLSPTQIIETTAGLRPVINLKSDVTFSGGNGTLDNPYVVS